MYKRQIPRGIVSLRVSSPGVRRALHDDDRRTRRGFEPPNLDHSTAETKSTESLVKVWAWLSRKSMAKLGHLAVRDCPAGQLPATRVGHIRTVRPRRKGQTVASCHKSTVCPLRRGRTVRLQQSMFGPSHTAGCALGFVFAFPPTPLIVQCRSRSCGRLHVVC